MMVPPDPATVTLEVKNRLSHVSGSLHRLSTEPGLIFSDPKWVPYSQKIETVARTGGYPQPA
jgi:hypothetical protein